MLKNSLFFHLTLTGLLLRTDAFTGRNLPRILLWKNKAEREHMTEVLGTLHWLLVSPTIDFKVLLLVYKALRDLRQAYITNSLLLYVLSRALRSSTGGFLATWNPTNASCFFFQLCFQSVEQPAQKDIREAGSAAEIFKWHVSPCACFTWCHTCCFNYDL